jgi:hypothetical protein
MAAKKTMLLGEKDLKQVNGEIFAGVFKIPKKIKKGIHSAAWPQTK